MIAEKPNITLNCIEGSTFLLWTKDKHHPDTTKTNDKCHPDINIRKDKHHPDTTKTNNRN